MTGRGARTRIALTALLGFWTACSSESEPPPAIVPEPVERPPEPEPAPELAPEPEPEVDLELGWSEPPPETTPGDRAALRAALELHEQGDYAASEAAFRAVVEESPNNPIARFDHACALARLGREAEAGAILEALLSADLPGFSPRLDADPDLATLRGSPEGARLDALRTRLRARWRRALAEGMPFTIGDGSYTRHGSVTNMREWSRAGVWLRRERRFVPMGPLISRAARYDEEIGDYWAMGSPIVSVLLDAALGRVLTLTGIDSESEGDDIISESRFAVYDPVEGTEIGTAIEAPYEPVLHATPGGGVVEWSEAGDRRFRAVHSIGTPSPFDPHHVPRMEATMDHTRTILAAPVPGARVVGRTLIAPRPAASGTGDVRVVLDPAHPPVSRDSGLARIVAASGERIWVMTSTPCSGDPDDYHAPGALSLVDLATGTATLIGGAQRWTGTIAEGRDGAIYTYLDRLVRVSEDGRIEPLPEWLHLGTDTSGCPRAPY